MPTKGRYELNELLKSCIEDSMTRQCVFYNPPDTITLTYPCIVYHTKYGNTTAANNKHYSVNIAYDVQVITKGNGDDILQKIYDNISECRFDSNMQHEGLNHMNLTVYYRL